MIEKVNLLSKLDLIGNHYDPKKIAEVNDTSIKLVKVKGDFLWHHHDHEDELFLVIKGELLIKLRDQQDIFLKEGEMVMIPRGVEHMPVAEEEACIVLIEPDATLNTGNVQNERTVGKVEDI